MYRIRVQFQSIPVNKSFDDEGHGGCVYLSEMANRCQE